MADEIVLADKAFELDKQVDICRQQLGRNFLLMGRILKEIRDGGYSTALVGEDNENPFDVYLASKKINRVSGMQWIKIYETFVDKLGIEEEKLAEIGWHALLKLLPVVSEENKEKWIEKAEALSLSDLETEIRAKKVKDRHDKIFTDDASSMKTEPREKEDIRKVDVISGLNDLADDSVDAVISYPTFSEDEGFSNALDRHTDWLSGAFRVVKPTGALLLFVNTESLPSVSAALRQTGFTIIRDIIWVHKPKTISQGLQKAHGTVLWAKKGQYYVYNLSEPTTDVWNIFDKAKHDDPRDLPQDLVLRIIEMGTDPKQLILDPFCGWGTILEVAKKAGRDIVGFETDENAYGMTISRLK
jgi:DNA modification methylase